MLRLLFSISFSFLLLIPGLRDLGIFLDFKINQQRIETEKCVNKSRPAKACHGHCYLKKVLEENHKKEQNSGTLPLTEPFKLTYVQTLPLLKTMCHTCDHSAAFVQPPGMHPRLEEKGIFHPPRRQPIG